MRFKFPPLYDIYTPQSVYGAIISSLRGKKVSGTTEEIIQSFLELHQSMPSGEFTSDDVMAQVKATEKQLINLCRDLSRNNVLYVLNSRPEYIYRFQDACLREKANMLEMLAFPQKLRKIITYYRDIEPDELAYITNWKNDPGLPEGIICEFVEQVLRMESSINAYEMLDYIHLAVNAKTRGEVEENLKETQRCYKGMLHVFDSFNIRKHPEENDIQMYRKWTEEWEFTDKDIKLIAANVIDADYPIKYLDGYLRSILIQKGPHSTEYMLQIEEELKRVYEEIGLSTGKINNYAIDVYLTIREHYDADMALAAAKSVSRSGEYKRISLERVLEKLDSWASMGITTPMAAEAYDEAEVRVKRFASEIYDEWGMSGMPSKADVRHVQKWLNWGLDEDLILYAVRKACDMEKPFAYTEKILLSYKGNHIHNVSEALVAEEKYRKEHKL